MKEHTDNSDLVVLNRRQFVLDSYLKGFTPNQIYKEWCTMFPDLSKHSFDKDVTAAYEELKLRGQRDTDAIITKHLMYLEDMYKEARSNGDISNAVKVLKEVRETVGITTKGKATVQINQTVNNNSIPSDLSVEQIKEMLGLSDSKVIDITPLNPIE